MSPALGVLIVHGMGDQKPPFADAMIAELDARLSDKGVAAGTIVWERGYWADLLNDVERDLWNRLRENNDLDWTKVRRFFINAFGDAVAYRRAEGSEDSIYELIHADMLRHLRNLQKQLGGDNKPIVVLAHSLGSVIMSDYIWNEQRVNVQRRGKTPLERMETLCGFVTFGSNIPLFTLALPKVQSITFPPPTLSGPLKAAARWLNFYDPDDVLGWPLRPLSASYGNAVSEDRAINAGGLVTSWNPMSHGEYWTDDDFTTPVVDLLVKLVRAAQKQTAKRR